MDSYFVVVVVIFIVVFPIIVIGNLVAGPSMVTIRTNVFYAVAVGIVHAAEGTCCCHCFLYLRVKPFINSVSEGTYSYNGVQPTITVAFDQSADFETNLERIVTQKYISMFPNGNEAWAEFRRTGYPRLMPVAVNKNVNQVPQGEFARRLWYPQEEYKDNGQNVAAAIADLTPQADLMSSRMWWDCNPRTK